ncbi:MAG TPA: hypothetical protein VGH15_12530, partial [Caulobacteraceae bacterium]
MFAPTHTPPTPEEIAAAVARAERRLRLLDVMIGFCMALARMLEFAGDAAVEAYLAISKAVRLGIRLEMETHRLLMDLKRGVFPAPKAVRPRASATAPSESAEGLEERERREPVETESDTGFRNRLEDFEALLSAHADAPDWSPHQTAVTLCRVLGLDPDWIAWLGDGWIEEHLNLKRLLADPLPPLLGRVDREAGRVGDAAPPHPALRATFPIKGKEELRNPRRLRTIYI